MVSGETGTELTIRRRKAGDIGYVVYRHGVLYAQEYGLDHGFETYVLSTMEPFVEEPYGTHNQLWVAEINGRFAGCIGLVRVAADRGQLRWLLVEPEYRGRGVASQLMKTLIDFAGHSGLRRIFLWTLSNLHDARRLYERFGFERVETRDPVPLWGHEFAEERWELEL